MHKTITIFCVCCLFLATINYFFGNFGKNLYLFPEVWAISARADEKLNRIFKEPFIPIHNCFGSEMLYNKFEGKEAQFCNEVTQYK